MKSLELSDRDWKCPCCHTMHDRDASVAAAMNLRKLYFDNLLENRKFCGIELNQNTHLFKQSDKVMDYIDFAKNRLDEVGVVAKVVRAK